MSTMRAPGMPSLDTRRAAVFPENISYEWSSPPSEELLTRIEHFLYLVEKCDKSDNKSYGVKPFWRIAETANKVFGFNGWSIEIVSNDITKSEAPHDNGPFSITASAEVKLSFPGGVYHHGFGEGRFVNSPSKGAALEKAKKEAVTDATKKALLSLRMLATGDAEVDADYSKVTVKAEEE